MGKHDNHDIYDMQDEGDLLSFDNMSTAKKVLVFLILCVSAWIILGLVALGIWTLFHA